MSMFTCVKFFPTMEFFFVTDIYEPPKESLYLQFSQGEPPIAKVVSILDLCTMKRESAEAERLYPKYAVIAAHTERSTVYRKNY